METKKIITFISYCWEGDEHHAWVNNLANWLRYEGIEVILDQDDLGYGQDTHSFMEQAIQRADRVLLILTPRYKARIKMRGTGVWLEYNAMRPYFPLDLPFQAAKFIPVIRHSVRAECTPYALRHRLGIDLSADPIDKRKFRELVAAIKNIKQRPYVFDPKDLTTLTAPFTANYRRISDTSSSIGESDLAGLLGIVKGLHPYHERIKDLPDIFHLWWMNNPYIFRPAYKTITTLPDKQLKKELIGFTCVIPLSKKAFSQYKSGRLSEWDIGKFKSDIVKDTVKGNCRYLLIQSLELSEKYWSLAAYVAAFNYSLLRHLAHFNNDPMTSKMMLVADGNTKGDLLLINRGFQTIVYASGAVDNRPRYLLDFGEQYLNPTAQTTVDNVSRYLSSFRNDINQYDNMANT